MIVDEQLYMTVLQISGYHCSYCGEGLDDKSSQVDFKHPRSLGGDKTVENLAACCKPCLKLKGHKTLEEFRAFIFDSVAVMIDKAFDEVDKVSPLMAPNDNQEVERVLVAAKVRLKRLAEQRRVVFYFEEEAQALADTFSDTTVSTLN